MEDENGLELSLALSCGGLSAKSKGKTGNSSDTRIDEVDKGSNVVDNFRNFFQHGIQKQDSTTGSQINDHVKPQENFFNNLSKAASGADASINLNGGGIWVAKSNSTDEVEEENRSEAGNKRKMLFDEMNQQKKHEKEAHHAEQYDKAKTSHISITTEDGSTTENEDVADSEVDGSTSRLVTHHEEGTKLYTGGGRPSDVPKETHRYTDSSVVELQAQKRFNIPSENEFKHGKLTYGVPYAVQQINMMNTPYPLPAKESNSVSAPGTSGYPLTGMVHMMPPANGERPVTSADLPLGFGYPSIQLPVLEKDHSWLVAPHSQQLHPAFSGRGAGGIAPNSEKPNDGLKISQVSVQAPPPNLSETLRYGERRQELPKGDGKQHATEEGSSSQKEDGVKKDVSIFKAKDASDRPTAGTLSYEGSAIRPGVDADLKFGGYGSYPDLPWVSTTGPGPNGRTISGVTYRFSGNQIKVVCACHGSHLTPEEFVQHASEENPSADTGNGSVSFSGGNHAASAPS